MRILSFLAVSLVVLSANATVSTSEKHVTCLNKSNGDIFLELVISKEGDHPAAVESVSFGRSDWSQQSPFFKATINTNIQPSPNAFVYDLLDDSKSRSIAVSFDVLDSKPGLVEVDTTKDIAI